MTEDRIALLRDGLRWGLSTNLELGDEDLEYNLLEQFDLFVSSDLHPDNLLPLVHAGLIGDDEFQLAQQLRKSWLQAIEGERSATAIRKSGSVWQKVLAYTDQLWTALEKRLERSGNATQMEYHYDDTRPPILHLR